MTKDMAKTVAWSSLWAGVASVIGGIWLHSPELGASGVVLMFAAFVSAMAAVW